jgi:hypothetical protein
MSNCPYPCKTMKRLSEGMPRYVPPDTAPPVNCLILPGKLRSVTGRKNIKWRPAHIECSTSSYKSDIPTPSWHYKILCEGKTILLIPPATLGNPVYTQSVHWTKIQMKNMSLLYSENWPQIGVLP